MGILSRKDRGERPKGGWFAPIDPPKYPSSYGDFGNGDAELPPERRPPVQPRAAVIAKPQNQRSADPRIRAALEVVYEHAETDDPQTLKWILDQVIQKLHVSKEEYEVWVIMYNRRPAIKDWETGVRP